MDYNVLYHLLDNPNFYNHSLLVIFLLPMLFDLKTDPKELNDLGSGKDINEEITKHLDRLYGYLAEWSRRSSQRNTLSDREIELMRGKGPSKGITLGLFDGTEIDQKFHVKYRGKGTRI